MKYRFESLVLPILLAFGCSSIKERSLPTLSSIPTLSKPKRSASVLVIDETKSDGESPWRDDTRSASSDMVEKLLKESQLFSDIQMENHNRHFQDWRQLEKIEKYDDFAIKSDYARELLVTIIVRRAHGMNWTFIPFTLTLGLFPTTGTQSYIVGIIVRNRKGIILGKSIAKEYLSMTTISLPLPGFKEQGSQLNDAFLNTLRTSLASLVSDGVL